MARCVENTTLLSVTSEEHDDEHSHDQLVPPPRSGMGVAGGASASTSAGYEGQNEGAGRSTPSLDADRFTPRGIIGRGGSSVVIRAFDRDILREVAIKILAADPADSGVEVIRFTEEARITGQLEHPNIVPIYEYGRDRQNQRFLCMKLVEGLTLEDTLHRLGDARLAPEHLAELLEVFVKVCDAIGFAHSRGVIHRDLKPTNIMLSEFGQVYVLDWGVARRLRPPGTGTGEIDPPGALIGTACYMAPEQVQGLHDALDARTDVFALGATLYQVLTGKPPLTPEIVRALWMRRAPPPITPPENLAAPDRVPVELSRIALRAMSYDPAARYPSVADMKRDIELFQRGSWDLPRVSFPAGAVIVTEGDPGHEAYVIVEGQCSAYRVEGTTEIGLRTMGPGDVFGETAVFSAKPRTASVKAVTNVVLLVVTSQVLSNAVGLHSWMGTFVTALANRFREVDEKLRTLEQQRRAGSER
jgi:CRP-like cAMP-binding protein/tRNA A-37 threonylcarbamoyl transferase component Bud32